MSRYEIKQNGVLINTIMASAEFVDEHFPLDLYEVTFAPTADMVRNERDIKLATEVDVFAANALRWAALGADAQAEWSAYRQELLDVPQQDGFPHEITWPDKPKTI